MTPLLCPVHATPLMVHAHDHDSHTCPTCQMPWLIIPDTSHRATFNRSAPFAQLVIDIDKLTHKHPNGAENETAPSPRAHIQRRQPHLQA